MFTLVPFMILDGFLLYIVILGFAVVELIAMEQDRPGSVTAIFIVALLVLQFCSHIQPLSFAFNHPGQALIIVGSYFVVGSIWIIVKWLSHVYTVRDRFNAVKQECIDELKRADQRNINFAADGTLTDDGKLRIYKLGALKINERNLPLLVSQHKSDMYMWWVVWPLSLFWTVLNDPITRLWNFVYNMFGNWMQKVSDRSIDLK
jgi:hypothetical protein